MTILVPLERVVLDVVGAFPTTAHRDGCRGRDLVRVVAWHGTVLSGVYAFCDSIPRFRRLTYLRPRLARYGRTRISIRLVRRTRFGVLRGGPIIPPTAWSCVRPARPSWCAASASSESNATRGPVCMFANQTKLLLPRFLRSPWPSATRSHSPFHHLSGRSGNPRHQERLPDESLSLPGAIGLSASPSRTNETSTSSRPKFARKASASARFSCLARSSARTRSPAAYRQQTRTYQAV